MSQNSTSSRVDLATSPHWADHAARRVVASRHIQPGSTVVVASGITPSGVVHVGNFREVITVDLVARALRDSGWNVRFLYSWDDFDTFRKVPKNLPAQEMLAGQLRRPISRVPDPRGEAASYSDYNIRVFEREIKRLGIAPEFIYQHERYSTGAYAAQIRQALENRDKIREILNRHRTSPLEESWLPTAIYCESCDRDTMDWEKWAGEWAYAYKCSTCGHEATTDIRKTRNLKLNWRTDWPMRWAYESVDFEPGGKDHSSEGGSYDTAKVIVKDIWGREAPTYLQYDFVMIKGGTGKMSSSSGELYTVTQVLEVYTPQMVRWIFASQRPNTDFALAFDLDVIKVYEEFDRAEALALDPAGAAASPKWAITRRTWELSQASASTADWPTRAPVRPGFRDLCNRLQICGGDIARTMSKYWPEIAAGSFDACAFEERAERALFWIEHYAPDEFRYTLNTKVPDFDLTQTQKASLVALKELVTEIDLDAVAPKDLNQLIYDRAIHGVSCDPKDAFRAIYQRLISRDQGPRLPGFLKEIGRERLLELLA
jgi:lysyl-tRNA synthetase class 1